VTQSAAPLPSNRADTEIGNGAASIGRLKLWVRRAIAQEWAGCVVVAFVLAVAGQFYLAPASDMMWARDRTHLMSNGGDATTLPFNYQVVQRAAEASARNLLYGSIYNPQLGPPAGSGMWVPWLERWLVVLFGNVLPVEAIPTAFVWVLMVLAGVCFYAFARLEHWPRLLAFSFAFAFAFNPYTRARGVVHDALVGIYCVPLIFVAVRYVKRLPTAHRITVSAALLLFALWTAHYYIIMLAVISPLLLWFLFRDDEDISYKRSIWPNLVQWTRFGALALAAAPALAFLAWNVLKPLAPNVPPTHAAAPTHELAQMYLRVYAARPVDYLSNDVALGPRDLNPLRRKLNVRVANDLDGSNLHERSNGIRWSVLLPFLLLALLCASPQRRRLRSSLQGVAWRKLQYWMIFAAVMFWLSLSPASLKIYGHELGPSSLVHELVPAFRVPSRFGAFFHFAVLAAVGTFASAHWHKWFGPSVTRWRRALPCLLPMLIVLDYPPLQPVAIDRTLPPRSDLMAAGSGSCGVGMHFPYSHEEHELYPAIQALRDTDCGDLNQPLPTAFDRALLDGLGDDAFNKALASPAHTRAFHDRFIRFARCAKLDWVIFYERVPEAWRQELCRSLGWEPVSEDACASRAPRAAQFVDPAPACSRILEADYPAAHLR
jgi:hypothetical protein